MVVKRQIKWVAVNVVVAESGNRLAAIEVTHDEARLRMFEAVKENEKLQVGEGAS